MEEAHIYYLLEVSYNFLGVFFFGFLGWGGGGGGTVRT